MGLEGEGSCLPTAEEGGGFTSPAEVGAPSGARTPAVPAPGGRRRGLRRGEGRGGEEEEDDDNMLGGGGNTCSQCATSVTEERWVAPSGEEYRREG